MTYFYTYLGRTPIPVEEITSLQNPNEAIIDKNMHNPVMMVDPDGHFPWFIPVAIVGVRVFGKVAIRYGTKYGKKIAKSVWNKGKSIVRKSPRIHKIGRIKGANDKGKGYCGIIYSTKKKTGKRTYSSLEFHTPHNNHGYHLQKNKYSKYKGNWNRGKATWRKTLWRAKNRR